jgi:hypothetical protein
MLFMKDIWLSFSRIGFVVGFETVTKLLDSAGLEVEFYLTCLLQS